MRKTKETWINAHKTWMKWVAHVKTLNNEYTPAITVLFISSSYMLKLTYLNIFEFYYALISHKQPESIGLTIPGFYFTSYLWFY